MPIYEFYCRDCHAIFSFLSRSVDTAKRPGCPRCGRSDLDRQASAFAISKGRTEPEAGSDLGDLDESNLEQAMAELARESQGLNEDDPREVAGLMRKLFDRTGLPQSDGMLEAMRRMESGQDPDKIEEEMGEMLDAEERPLLGGASRGVAQLRRRMRPPEIDKKIYEL